MIGPSHVRNAAVLRQITLLAFAIAGFAAATAPSGAQSATGSSISLPTVMHLREPGWWPTKSDAAREDYVGSGACASCHEAISATYETTAMAHAAAAASDSLPLRSLAPFTYSLGAFRGEIVLESGAPTLVVSGNSESVVHPLGWAFGEAHMGQTFVYQQNGKFFESHMSFYEATHALDVTPGQNRSLPATAEGAAGRAMLPGEPELCFGCHTTESSAKNQFDPRNAVLGVACEHCHGPGGKHAAAMSLGMEVQGASAILNPAHLSPVESVDFCGACHRTWQDVVSGGFVGLGVYNVRFAPYRLENSKCWRGGDPRLTCVACHDPHKRLVTDAASYDAKCLRCHLLRAEKKSDAASGHHETSGAPAVASDSHAVANDRPGRACPKASANCVTCHMPKIEPPNLHSSFTDHWIRVVQPGKPYPD